MSSEQKEISLKLFSFSDTLKCSVGFVTVQADLGGEKTPSYWSFRASAVCLGEGFGKPLDGSTNSPTFAFIQCLDLANEKKALLLDLILNTAWSSSMLLVAV